MYLLKNDAQLYFYYPFIGVSSTVVGCAMNSSEQLLNIEYYLLAHERSRLSAQRSNPYYVMLTNDL